MPLTGFDPPAFLDDLNPAQKLAWSRWISDNFDRARAGRPDLYDFDGPREQFFNPQRLDFAPDKQALDISWTAFPRNVTVSSIGDRQRWKKAEGSRDLQDEYCEWSVTRDSATGKITKVTFTCEGPEYWEFLAHQAPDVVLNLYRMFIGPHVERSDLFTSDGAYNPRNRWNSTTTDGAMHLIQVNNSLSAEIELAAGSSVVRVIDGRTLTEERELIKCGQYGGIERHSDPHIGAMVNSLTRQKAEVTLENPVGLYFNDLSTAGWQAPDGSDPKGYWKYTRGSQGKFVRAIYEVPPSTGFAVGDITINGRLIEFGAQIADFISIKLTGVATRIGTSTAQAMTGCRRRRAVGIAAGFESVAAISVESSLVGGRRASRLSANPVSQEFDMETSSPIRLSPGQSLRDLAEQRWASLALEGGLPAELALATVYHDLAQSLANAVIKGKNLDSLLRDHGMSDPSPLVNAVEELSDSRDKQVLVDALFIVLNGDGLEGLPTARCIRSKLPKGRRPTEEELKKAFKECAATSKRK
jgi:hypothetical protein